MTSRLSTVDPTSSSGKVQELFGAIKSKFGKVPNMMKTMAHSPALLEGYLAFNGALQNGELAPAVREQIALAVSQVNQCEYCLSAHSLLAKLAGLNPDQIIAARQGKSQDPKVQAVLTLALNVVERRGNVSDDQLNDARHSGLSDSEIAEVIGHVAVTNLTNYFNQLSQTEVDFPKVPLSL